MKDLSAFDMPLTGIQLVEASAGTGKTYTIASLFVRLVLERRLRVGQVLVVTYTRAATAELRDRVRRRLQDVLDALAGRSELGDPAFTAYLDSRQSQRAEDMQALREALLGFDEAAISTIHGFCQRAQGDSAFESGASYELNFLEDERPLLRELVDDFWATTTYRAPVVEVQALQRKGRGTPSALLALATRVAGSAHVPVLPEQVELPDQVPLEAWQQARDRVVAYLDTGKAELEHWLLHSPILNRSKFRRDTVTGKLLPALTGLRLARPGELPDILQRLTPAYLETALRSGQTLETLPVCEAMQALWGLEQAYLAYQDKQVLKVKRAFVHYLHGELQRRKAERGVQSFDDLLTGLDTALQGPQGEALEARIRTTYGAALIDEFQDTDPMQYRVFRRLFGTPDRSLFLIGDPKQAIYAFRGADIFAYLAAAEAARDNAHTLGRNFRSDPGLIGAVNHLFAAAKAPFLFADIHYPRVTPAPDAKEHAGGSLQTQAPLQLLFVDDEVKKAHGGAAGERTFVAEVTATEIVRLLQADDPALLGGRPVVPADLAVLCRTNAEATEVQGALQVRGVPSVVEGDSSVFDAPVAEELQRVLTAMAFPEEPRRLRAALATSLLGCGGAELEALADDDQQWELWVERFLHFQRMWTTAGFIQAFTLMLHTCQVQVQLFALRDGERRMTDLLHLAELLHGVAARQRLGPLSLLHFLSDMRSDREARGAVLESAQLRLESDARAVRITTIHRSKGLEYPIVFCPYLSGAAGLHRGDLAGVRFHDPAADYALKIDLDAEPAGPNCVQAEAEALSEGLRLLYVALTRPRHRCFVVWGKLGGMDRSALGYLLHGGVGQPGELPGLQAQLKKLTSADLRQVCEAQASASQGLLGVRAAQVPSVERYEMRWTVPELQAMQARGHYHQGGFALQSFSGLTTAASGHRRVRVEPTDRDDGTGVPVTALGAVQPAQVRLADFPAGARAGTLVHEVFEHLDFLGADSERVRAEVDGALLRYGEDPSWGEDLTLGVLDCLATPLAGPGSVRLADLSREDRLDEMEFTLPAGTKDRPIGLAEVADVFEQHADSLPVPSYGGLLRRLPADRFFGYLRGFVDLIFRHEGRYYLIDYKSNRLGTTQSDYVQAALVDEMAGHHYVLQYHLYLVALDRHLRRTLPSYDYDRDLGGVYYLFLRGMNGEPGAGVYADRPCPELIADLAALFTREDQAL